MRWIGVSQANREARGANVKKIIGAVCAGKSRLSVNVCFLLIQPEVNHY